MDFYYGRMSGNSARVAFCLGELGTSYTPHLLDPRKGENRTPAYLAVNPMGKIPALIDGAFSLWESNAINWYLSEKSPAARLVPDTIEGRAEVHRWLFFQSAHVSPACVPVFRATHPRMISFWGPADSRAAEPAMKELARFLPVLEQRLAGRDWLAERYSLADLAYAPHFFLLAGGGYDFSPHPRLKAWLDRLLARPAWRATEKMIFSGD